MGWSTTVIAPPDGDMTAYFASLDKLLARDDRDLFPRPRPGGREARTAMSAALIAHRRMREKQILDQARRREGSRSRRWSRRCMRDVDPRLHGAAGRSVLAHLRDLERRGHGARGGRDMDPRLKRPLLVAIPIVALAGRARCWARCCGRAAPPPRARSAGDRRDRLALGPRAGAGHALCGPLRRHRQRAQRRPDRRRATPDRARRRAL